MTAASVILNLDLSKNDVQTFKSSGAKLTHQVTYYNNKHIILREFVIAKNSLEVNLFNSDL